MTDKAKRCVDMLREGACCSYCAIAFPTVGYPYPCEERVRTNSNMDEAANLIESLSAELEQVKRERDAAVKILYKEHNCHACNKNGCADCRWYDDITMRDRTLKDNWRWRGAKE